MQGTDSLQNKDIRFEALFNSASLGIIVVDKQGKIVMSNNFANELFGYSSHSLEGQQLETLIPQRYHHKHVGDRESYQQNPKSRGMGIGMTLSAVRKDGSEFPVEVSLGHFKTNEDQFVIAYIADITKRKENEEKIVRQQADLEKEKEVNDLKTRFVSMASHEFRTPLSTILSSISLLAKYTNTDDQPKRDKHIDRIKSSVKTLTDILNEFLSLGRIEEGKVDVKSDEFDLTSFISSIINEMNVLLKEKQSIQHTHIGPPMTYSDSNLLKHVIVNLLSNAIKFSPEKSTILIESKIEEDYTYLQITDQGIGIPKSDQPHLFQRFFRATNVTNIQGTGLGLHIVGRYVELLKGHITYNSELESGSTFNIQFPSKKINDFED